MDDRPDLEALLARHLPWVRERVSRRLGGVLRRLGDTQDYVQDALVEVLRHGPRFTVRDETTFRRLLARIVEHVLCDQYDWLVARRREIHREHPLPDDTVLCLDQAVPTPSAEAGRHEEMARVRLALELLDGDDRRLVLERHWEGRSFRELGRERGLSEDAVRMRCHRVLLRLQRVLEGLRTGRVPGVLGGDGPAGRGAP